MTVKMMIRLLVLILTTAQASANTPHKNMTIHHPPIKSNVQSDGPPSNTIKAGISPQMLYYQLKKRTFGKPNYMVINEGLSRIAYNITRTAEMVRTWTEYGNDVESLAKVKEKKFCSEHTSRYSRDLFRRFEDIIGALGENTVHINEYHLLNETHRRQVQSVVGQSLIPAIDQFVTAATTHDWNRPKPCNESLWDVDFIRADDLMEKNRDKMANLEYALKNHVFQMFDSSSEIGAKDTIA